MGRLIYSAITSLDGYVEDSTGKFDWAAPDEEVHAFVNDLERPIGTYLYGRRMYETMLFWETAHTIPDRTVASRDFTDIWQGAAKIVYSRTLDEVRSGRTSVERSFDVEAVRRMKAEAEHDLSIGGAELAGQAMAAGLVDELQLLVVPVIVGGGKKAVSDGVTADLNLRQTRRFASGAVFLGYEMAT